MKKRGFTLIELMIVVAIIGLLSTIIITQLGPERGKARDAKRKMDLVQIRTALSLYYSKYGHYPRTPVETTSWSAFLNSLAKSSNSQPWIEDKNGEGSLTEFISTIPVDPAGGGFYYSYGTDATGKVYDLNAILENGKDSQTSQYQCWEIHTFSPTIWCYGTSCTSCGGAGPGVAWVGWNSIFSDHH